MLRAVPLCPRGRITERCADNMTSAVPILRTPRLTLRPLVPEDARAIAAGVGNYEVSKWLAVVPYPYDVEDAVQFLARVAVLQKPFWAICDDEGLQGIISLDDELAYWLARSAWGKGYGFEAAHAVCEYWFTGDSRGPLPSGYFDGNERSGSVLRALGFRAVERVERYARSFGQNVMSNKMELSLDAWTTRNGFRVETERLSLRPLDRNDVDAILPLGAPEVAMQTASVTASWSRDVAEDWLSQRLWTGRASGMLGVFRDNVLVGAVGAGGAPANAGWMIIPTYWGQGFATEAMRGFIPAFFARTTYSEIEAEVFADNPASQAVAEKLGFKPTGKAMGTSLARLEPQPVITYALSRDSLEDRL